MRFKDDKQFDQITRIIIAMANGHYDKRIEIKHLNNKLATISVLLNMLSGILKNRMQLQYFEGNYSFNEHLIFIISKNYEILDYNSRTKELFLESDLKHLKLVLDKKSLSKIIQVISSQSFDRRIDLNFKLEDDLNLKMNSQITRFCVNSSENFILSADRIILKNVSFVYPLTKNTNKPKRQFNISKNKMVIDKLYHYLMDNLDTPLKPIPKIAEELGANPSLLIRGFKSLYGKSVATFHREKRLEKAFDLLHDTDIKLKNIAEECGFKSLAHFSRTFKKYYGVNPSDSR